MYAVLFLGCGWFWVALSGCRGRAGRLPALRPTLTGMTTSGSAAGRPSTAVPPGKNAHLRGAGRGNFSDRPVTRRGTTFPNAPQRGPRRSVTSYRPVADMLAPEILAQEADGDPLQVRRFYEEALREYRRGLVEQGWPVEDVGSAIAVYLNNHYTVVFGQPMPPGVPYALYELFQGILGNDGDFTASSDRERQLLAESLAILATAMYSQYTSADGRERERLRQQARANLESFTGQSAEEFRDLVLAIRDQL